MIQGNTKYDRILNILRKSKPVLRSAEDIEEKIMNSIMQKGKKKESSLSILDFLFGWVFVGWVRSGLVAASVLLIIAFAYQQTVILKRINNLNRKAVFIESQIVTGTQDLVGERFLYKLAGRKLPAGSITISEKQMGQIMKSYKELQEKYKDLVKVIEEDPELMKFVEDKLTENNKKKLNL